MFVIHAYINQFRKISHCLKYSSHRIWKSYGCFGCIHIDLTFLSPNTSAGVEMVILHHSTSVYIILWSYLSSSGRTMTVFPVTMDDKHPQPFTRPMAQIKEATVGNRSDRLYAWSHVLLPIPIMAAPVGQWKGFVHTKLGEGSGWLLFVLKLCVCQALLLTTVVCFVWWSGGCHWLSHIHTRQRSLSPQLLWYLWL